MPLSTEGYTMRNLIRVTNSAGTGMYRCGIAYNIVGSVSTHPTPEEDPKLRGAWREIPLVSRPAWYFGFATVQQLCDWLGRLFFDLTRYEEADACVEIWLCPDEYFHEGMEQAIFMRERCALIKRIPYAEFYRDYCDGYHLSRPSGVYGDAVSNRADGAYIP